MVRALDKTLSSVLVNARQCLFLGCAGFAEMLGSPF